MRRPFLTKLLVAAAALALACTSDRSPLPTQPPLYSNTGVAQCDAIRVAKLINALFPPGSARIAAFQSFLDVQASMSKSTSPLTRDLVIAFARKVMFAFVKRTLAALAAGQLNDPMSTLGLTRQQAVAELIAQLYKCVGLEAPGDLTGALSAGAAAAVVGPTDPDIVVKTEGDQAGVQINTGDISLTQTVLVTVVPDPAGTNPFPNPAGLQTFPPFYDFRTSPDVPQFNRPVLVGICVDPNNVHDPAQAQRLQLAHADHTNSTMLQILARQDAGFLSTCGFFPNEGSLRVAPAGRKGFIGWLAQRAIALVRPQPLHAGTLVSPGGLGGLTSNFTDFRAVDPQVTVTRFSGSGSIGSLDPNNQFTIDNGETFSQAFIVAPNPAYAVIPGTNYINRNPDLTGPEGTTTDPVLVARYRTPFTLPAGFTSPSLAIQIHADNVARIFLNGTQIGQQEFKEVQTNFQDPPQSFTTIDATLFRTGANALEFEIFNFTGPTAFDYKAVLTYQAR